MGGEPSSAAVTGTFPRYSRFGSPTGHARAVHGMSLPRSATVVPGGGRQLLRRIHILSIADARTTFLTSPEGALADGPAGSPSKSRPVEWSPSKVAAGAGRAVPYWSGGGGTRKVDEEQPALSSDDDRRQLAFTWHRVARAGPA